MNKTLISTALVSALLYFSSPVLADVVFPAPSPGAKVTQKVGLGTVEIDYSRPGLKGRKIFGEQVPYGKLWRTGANAPTKLTFSEKVSLNNEVIPAGTYSLFSIPGEQEWTIILNKDGAVKSAGDYDQSKDQARFKVKPVALKESVESFTIGIDDLRDDSATLFLEWGHLRLPLAMKLNTKELVMAQIKEQMYDGQEKKAGEYASSAFYLYNNGGDLDQALEWMNKAIAMNPEAFYFLYRKALILAKLGRKQEARQAVAQCQAMVDKVPAFKAEYTYLNQQLLDSLK